MFCGSSSGTDEQYKEAAKKLGTLCTEQKWGLVYGGAHIGLMGIVADSALETGGEVTGIIPTFLKDKEAAHANLTNLHVTHNMHERQNRMAELSDAFVILPGGTGTLAEFFEVLTWKQLKLHPKPIVIVNTVGYWNKLIALINHLEEKGFTKLQNKNLFHIVENVEEIPNALKNS